MGLINVIIAVLLFFLFFQIGLCCGQDKEFMLAINDIHRVWHIILDGGDYYAAFNQ
jgi:hypothetical protein